ncbi:hypothetical protein Cs7R123_64870 [Catellatospora sp. TT07R-123]|uniref:EcsC family protein n=1 Tax=Catellatospora sp. TT07R-123 TaxID=2733863 RepID=UPI001B028B20|nr:EcsC family protein [Catellatospora sp. TT07R-123]GHJ49145.1 hypothetical protein Cs7R123_64870 [Catellatospora sp. TT07R-123]
MTVEVAAESPPAGLWETMRADPQYAPEHLALAAVRRIGPQAAQWARAMRERHPSMHPDGLAQLAVQRFRWHGRLSGAATGAIGLPGAVLDVAGLAWTQSRLVLHLAAVYGIDPTVPDRATDLLVLQRVHKAGEGARAALGVAAGREHIGAAVARVAGMSTARAMAQLSWRLARMAGVRAVRKVAAKAVPFAGIVLGAWVNSSAVNDVARRAIAQYRPPELTAVPLPRSPSA